MSVRVANPADAKVGELVSSAGPRARALGVKDAARRAPVVVLATPWAAARSALASAGELSGKVLLGCINPLAADLSGLLISHTSSREEQVASWAAGARVVKIFNTTGFGNMASPRYPEGPACMLYRGDDAAAKATAARLASDLGFDPIDAGP
ncbi:MAG TPA: NAD(P)-binding domain-containing protein, partial [Myxococcota bacterium]|nr:NAD(P)-binding domain-containing protein [Myxococcota bacterium]